MLLRWLTLAQVLHGASVSTWGVPRTSFKSPRKQVPLPSSLCRPWTRSFHPTALTGWTRRPSIRRSSCTGLRTLARSRKPSVSSVPRPRQRLLHPAFALSECMDLATAITLGTSCVSHKPPVASSRLGCALASSSSRTSATLLLALSHLLEPRLRDRPRSPVKFSTWATIPPCNPSSPSWSPSWSRWASGSSPSRSPGCSPSSSRTLSSILSFRLSGCCPFFPTRRRRTRWSSSRQSLSMRRTPTRPLIGPRLVSFSATNRGSAPTKQCPKRSNGGSEKRPSRKNQLDRRRTSRQNVKKML
mmetsp:Transcript_8933/g.28529  ORF Transcript_8933/g.28529 Transcript_8933/m.28529 type:complete len:301 (-) Transcript_8933:18-920(-)